MISTGRDQQRTELIHIIQTMRIKTNKIYSLILKEHDKLKGYLRELDSLEQKLMINFMDRPPEQLYEAVTLCHKCDIRRTDTSKNIDKKLDEPTKSASEHQTIENKRPENNYTEEENAKNIIIKK